MIDDDPPGDGGMTGGRHDSATYKRAHGEIRVYE